MGARSLVGRFGGYPGDRSPVEASWNCCPVAPFLGAFRALALSLRNLGLEVGPLVLYYSFRLSGVVPHDAEASDPLFVNSIESF